MSEEIKVSITLPRVVGEKLRAICHAQGKTASDVVAKWVVDHGAERPSRHAEFLKGLEDIVRGRKGGGT